MDQARVEINICMGSSCFSRGNKRLLQLIKEYLDERKLSGVVTFKGSHCMGLCDKGPILKIQGTCFQHVDNNEVVEILDSFFFP